MREREIGSVGVDTGQILIGDPDYVSKAVEVVAERIGGPITNEELHHCVRVYAPAGDGIYPVYEQLDDDGRFTGVLRVDLRPDDERGATLTPLPVGSRITSYIVRGRWSSDGDEISDPHPDAALDAARMCEQGGAVGVHVEKRIEQIVARLDSVETIYGQPEAS